MNTTNTQQPGHSHFEPTPKIRGTLNILWSSLFAILACTWTIQHLNVPEQRSSCKSGWKESLKWHTRKVKTKAQWMMITIIAPEVVIGMACYDLLSAKITSQILQRFVLEDDVPWTLTHSYFANMGGFVIESTTTTDRVISLTSLESEIPQYGVLRTSTGEIEDPLYCNPYHLTGRQIQQLRKKGILSKLPHISEAELSDRSKSDFFVKLVALFQILWVILQIVVRTIRKLVISQLELAVVAFAACAVIMYGLYWSKPKNVEATTTIMRYEGPIPQNVLRLIKCQHTYMGYVLKGDDSAKVRHGSPIRNDATESYINDEGSFWIFPAMIIGATFFGGIHIAAWNFQFPTNIEVILWRSASVYSAACGPVILLSGLLMHYFMRYEAGLFIFVQIPAVLYVIARLALLVEIFRTLFFLPPLAFVSTWTKDIPHFG